MTVRALDGVRLPKDPSCSGLKQTTSQRPTEVRARPIPIAARSSRPWGASASVIAGPNDGDLFSNTATS